MLRSGPPRGRRNTITRDDVPTIAAAAAASAVVAALAGCHPTGNPVGDALVTGGTAFGVAWLAATCSWWSLVLGGVVAMALGGGWLPVAFGAAAAATGLWLGDRKLSLPWLRAAGGGLVVQGLLRLETNPFFTASALAAGATMLFLAGIGVQRRRRHARRRILTWTLAGAGALVVLAAGFGLAAAGARSDIEDGYRGLLDGLQQLQSGDPLAAASTLRRAAAALGAADDSISAPWAQPARLVPVVAQHQQAVSALLGQASSSATAAAAALEVVDFDALTIEGGRIDVEAVAILEGPLADLDAAVGALQQALEEADSPWLIGPVAERLDESRQRAADAARQASTIHAAAVHGPALLGADGPRRYFVGFASPAEARSLIGVSGNYAVLTITDGRIERTAFGRINDLRNQVEANGPLVLEAGAEFFARYGPYGAGDGTAADPASPSFWSNVTMTPDMPTAAPLLAQLWAASGGDPVDGVILADPAALAGLLAATGPVTVAGLDAPLTAQTVERFLLLDQYTLDTPERRDLLEDVADATLQAVLGGSLPPPQGLARALGPAAAEGHLLMWTADPDEQGLLRQIGVDGALPALEGRDGLAVVNNNGTANKIDSFLDREVTYTAVYDADSGIVRGTITITLTNTAPSSGYPDYVLGSEFLDLPNGTNRTLLAVYTPLDAVGATLDGAPIGVGHATELGWNVLSFGFDLAPGEQRVLTLDVEGVIAGAPGGGYELILRPQPLAIDEAVTVHVGGDTDVHFSDVLTRRLVLSASGATAWR